MNRIDEINAHSNAHGWHAEQSKREALIHNETMADCFRRKIENSIAFSVPAVCTKITKTHVYYTFSDGSVFRTYNQNGKI